MQKHKVWCYLLLHWDEAMTSLPICISGKGEPLAKMALPPVAVWAWVAVHSDLEVDNDIHYLPLIYWILNLFKLWPGGGVGQWEDNWRSLTLIHGFQNLFWKQASTGWQTCKWGVRKQVLVSRLLLTYDNVWFDHFHSFQQTFSFHFSIWDCKTWEIIEFFLHLW